MLKKAFGLNQVTAVSKAMSLQKIKNIRLAEYNELALISQLMCELFHTKMQASYSKEGRKNFEAQIELAALQKRFLEENLFYIYIDYDDIKGVLELEKPCHIAFLFVKDERKGVGKNLCTIALENSTEEVCTVGVFEGAIGFYEKLGFIEVLEKKIFNAMEFTLMAKKTR